MLEQSILGKIYTVWIDSWVFRLLQRIYQALQRALQGSAILCGLFREGRIDAAFSDSAAVHLLRRICNFCLKLLSHLSGLVSAVEDSTVLGLVRGSCLGVLLSFEGLLGAFCLVMFLIPHNYWNNSYAAAAALAFLLLYLLLAASGRRKFVSPELFGPGGCLFLLTLILSVGSSADRGDSLRILLFFLASFALSYVAAADLREPERLRRLLSFLYAALLIVGYYAVIQNAFGLVEENASFTDLELNKGVPGRVYSTLSNPINLSEFILLFLPLGAAYAAGAKKRWQQIALVLGLIIPALALLYTYSRGGWVAIVLAAAVFTFCCNKRLIPALFVLGLLCIPLLPQSVLTRLSTIGSTKDSSTQHRLDIWRGVVQMLSDDGRWFTGIGLGPATFRVFYLSYSVGKAKVGAYHTQMHYLELITEAGLPCLIFFLYMMFKYLGRAGRALRSGLREHRLVLIACISSVAALAFVGLVEYIWFYPRIMFAFFLFLGILLAASAPAEKA